jgi:hypothetical protein
VRVGSTFAFDPGAFAAAYALELKSSSTKKVANSQSTSIYVIDFQYQL